MLSVQLSGRVTGRTLAVCHIIPRSIIQNKLFPLVYVCHYVPYQHQEILFTPSHNAQGCWKNKRQYDVFDYNVKNKNHFRRQLEQTFSRQSNKSSFRITLIGYSPNFVSSPFSRRVNRRRRWRKWKKKWKKGRKKENKKKTRVEKKGFSKHWTGPC